VRETGSYIFFGGLTTFVNFAVFFLLNTVLQANDKVAQAAAITSSIVFAFVVNKLFVFESRGKSREAVAEEFVKFVAGRAIVFVVEFFGYVALEYIFKNRYLAKILISVVVLALNYLFSKLFVFKKKKPQPEQKPEKDE
jgi:putative flippase GtrA